MPLTRRNCLGGHGYRGGDFFLALLRSCNATARVTEWESMSERRRLQRPLMPIYPQAPIPLAFEGRCQPCECGRMNVKMTRSGYQASMIRIGPPPPPVRMRLGYACARVYRYRFERNIKPAHSLADLGRVLSRRMVLDGIELKINIELRRRGARALSVSVVSVAPEDCRAFIYGHWGLPPEVDRLIARVRSINGHPRQSWRGLS